MDHETENKPYPKHAPQTFFVGETLFITEDPPGGLPLVCPEVIEGETKRQEQLAKKQGNDRQP